VGLDAPWNMERLLRAARLIDRRFGQRALLLVRATTVEPSTRTFAISTYPC
jgi:hypothetical protein